MCHENDSTNFDLPCSWKTITRTIAEQTNFYNCHKMTIEFPSHWKMEKWNSKNDPLPEKVVIRVRDILELIADQFVNPVIQFLWKDCVKLECYKKDNDQGENVTCNIMTSEWAHAEQKEIEKHHSNGLILPYIDGVSPGKNGQISVTPVIFTLGIFIDELRKLDISKNVIGFISKLGISDKTLINHLHEFVGLCRSKSKENIQYYKKQIYFKFWEIVLDSLKVAAHKGLLVKVLGHKEPKLFSPRIAFNAGDDPAQHEIASIKCGCNVKHTCIRCMYKSREGGLYVPNIDSLRDLSIKEKLKLEL